MVSKTAVIKNEQGLHMRPAGVFAKAMAAYEADVIVVYQEKRINAKSVMNLIAGCIKSGAEVTIECSGTDEQEACDKAVELITSGLGE